MPIPLYQQVYEAIIERILSGELAPGAMLPSEIDLGAELGVSQGTARKALIELEQRGIVLRQQGKGTFVAKTTPESVLFHFFRLRRHDGSQVFPELVSETIKRRRAKPVERKIFDAIETEVFEISRVRSVEKRPLIREDSLLPCAFFPGLMERAPLPNTLYELFQSAYGIAVVKAAEKLRAVAANEDDSKALNVAIGTPLIEVRREAIDISDRIVELRTSRYLTDDLHYDVRLT